MRVHYFTRVFGILRNERIVLLTYISLFSSTLGSGINVSIYLAILSRFVCKIYHNTYRILYI